MVAQDIVPVVLLPQSLSLPARELHQIDLHALGRRADRELHVLDIPVQEVLRLVLLVPAVTAARAAMPFAPRNPSPRRAADRLEARSGARAAHDVVHEAIALRCKATHGSYDLGIQA